MSDTTEEKPYDYRVTKTGGDVKLDIGDELSDLSNSIGVTAVSRAIGEGLIRIGTWLLQSSAEGDEDEGDW